MRIHISGKCLSSLTHFRRELSIRRHCTVSCFLLDLCVKMVEILGAICVERGLHLNFLHWLSAARLRQRYTGWPRAESCKHRNKTEVGQKGQV